ncbi:MAG: hypothetical protein P8Y77_10785 [Nitrospirota bacterium]
MSGSTVRKDSLTRSLKYSSRGHLGSTSASTSSALCLKASYPSRGGPTSFSMTSCATMPMVLGSISYSFISGGSRPRTLSTKNLRGQER